MALFVFSHSGKRNGPSPNWMAAGLSVTLVLTALGAPVHAQADPQVAAIQAVIQQNLQEEVQAVATHDPVAVLPPSRRLGRPPLPEPKTPAAATRPEDRVVARSNEPYWN